jgi:hypothetical protein
MFLIERIGIVVQGSSFKSADVFRSGACLGGLQLSYKPSQCPKLSEICQYVFPSLGTGVSDLSLKLMAAVRLTRIAIPLLRENGGAVLNTAAISGKAPDAGTTPRRG